MFVYEFGIELIMAQFIQPLVTIVAFLSCIVKAQIPPSLVGTWSTKSGKVLTGLVCFILDPAGLLNRQQFAFIEPTNSRQL